MTRISKAERQARECSEGMAKHFLQETHRRALHYLTRLTHLPADYPLHVVMSEIAAKTGSVLDVVDKGWREREV